MGTQTFKPYISAKERVPEFTVRSLILGVLLSTFFAIGNTYLGLKVGMTISASIPAAVLSMAILRSLFRSVSVLENNIVQTTASVGEGLAAGIIFSVPALFMLGAPISNLKIFILAFLGGVLGILFMIPMRRYIIVKEHGILPFPEGTACAEILKAGATSSKNAMMALWGILIGAVFKVFNGIFHLFHDVATFVIQPFEHTQIRLDASPALLGVGYIIGPKIAAVTFAGGAIGWWVLIPLIKMFGEGNVTVFPATQPIAQMDAMAIWSNYIRYIGAGAVAVGGLYNLARIFPMIVRTVHVGFKELFAGMKRDHLERTDTDISMGWLILGSIAIIVTLWLLPNMHMNLFTIVLLVVLGYFFVAVTSITVGLVGSSSNPGSGMVITTLLITTLIFTALGWQERIYLIMAITMSAVVNVAICLASTTSQDLKTGYLLGATPKWQQLAEIIGLLVPSILMGWILMLLNQVYVFGSSALPAPQATLLSIVAKGVLEQKLPAILVVLGIVLGIIVLLLRARVLPFAIGLYLPLEITTAIMIGGLTRAITHWALQKKEMDERGILAASGMVAGDACVGVIIALLTVLGFVDANAKPIFGAPYTVFSFLLLTGIFIALCLRRKNIDNPNNTNRKK